MKYFKFFESFKKKKKKLINMQNSEVYLEHSRTSVMDAKIVNGLKPLSIFIKAPS